MEYLQKLGKSLMLPITVLPIAAILNGIGYWLESVYPDKYVQIAVFLQESGSVVVENMPLLFAISIGMGMAKQKDAIGAISSLVSYLIITKLLSPETVALLFDVAVEQVSIAFENTENVFVGIASGIVASTCYNRFAHIQLPKSLSLFGGKRFVPIICIFIMLGISLIMLFVWPILYSVLFAFGESIAKMGSLGAGIYGFFNRILIPTGLHHALNAVFWFDVAGINDVGKYLETVSGGINGVTGIYQGGFFPIMMFGLPAAALAIFKNANEDKKKQIGSIMLAGAIASFLTGITEPLEFSFMFVAPGLFLVHALLTGITFFIAASFQWIAGIGFSAGFIDYILSIRSPFANHPYMLIVLGILCAIVYYFVFDFCIRKFNFATPGREKIEGDVTLGMIQQLLHRQEYDEIAILICDAIGGRNNISHIDTCITRLHIEVKQGSLVDKNKLLEYGILKVFKAGNNVQIMIGTDVQFIMEAMQEILE